MAIKKFIPLKEWDSNPSKSFIWDYNYNENLDLENGFYVDIFSNGEHDSKVISEKSQVLSVHNASSRVFFKPSIDEVWSAIYHQVPHFLNYETIYFANLIKVINKDCDGIISRPPEILEFPLRHIALNIVIASDN